jgi:GT2 family glycosyltransferase
MQTLDSLEQQSALGRFEVVVAIDGSTDGTAEALSSRRWSFPLRWALQTNAGTAAARNAAARLARHEVLIFLDDDQVAAPDLVAMHLAVHERIDNAIVQGSYPLASGFDRLGASIVYERTRTAGVADSQAGTRGRYLWGANFSVRRRTWREVGGFDEVFRSYGGEDTDFGLRVLGLGVPLVAEPRALSHHLHRVSYAGFRRNAFEAGRATVRISRKHGIALEALPGATMSRVDHLIGRAWRINPGAVELLGTVAIGGLWLADRTQSRMFQVMFARLIRRLHWVGGVTKEINGHTRQKAQPAQYGRR